MLLLQKFHIAGILALLGRADYSGVASSSVNTTVTTDEPGEESAISNAELASQLWTMEHQINQLQDRVSTLQLEAENIWKQFFLAQAQKHKKLANLYTQLATQQAQMVDAMDNMVETVRSFKATSAKAEDLQTMMEKALCHATPPLGHIFQLAPRNYQHQYSLLEADRACREHGGWLAEYSQLIKLERMESGPYHCGWVEGGRTYYPVWEETASCHGNKCIRIKTCDKGDKYHNAWCFQPLGICPHTVHQMTEGFIP
ncbi:uncharacterized protein LOC144864720 [Branchiostoma floridae x Branchiostoma japonicum]